MPDSRINIFMIFLFLITLLFFPLTLVAGLAENDHINSFGMFGYCNMFQRNDWIGADGFIGGMARDKSGDEMFTQTGFLNWVDYQTIPLPHMLLWQHSYYWVTVFPTSATFNVLYLDPYGVLPSTGYPRVDYRLKGAQNYSSLILNFMREKDGGRLYGAEVALTTGTYEYRYIAHHPIRPEYSLALSSFVVTRAPEQAIINEHKGIADRQTVSTARVVLSWGALDPEGNRLRYRLHFGTSAASMIMVYDGYNTSFEITSLDYGKNYFWQVEVVNIHGVEVVSPIYQFTTISKVSRAFNYPNPFNPSTQHTNIVFHMASPGSAELSIYTARGDIVWRKTFDNLPRGANEIQFDGRDDAGRVLYSGPYVVIINRIYSDRQERDKCRMLIIR